MQGETQKAGVWYREGNFFYILKHWGWRGGIERFRNAATIDSDNEAIADKIWIMLQKENQDAG